MKNHELEEVILTLIGAEQYIQAGGIRLACSDYDGFWEKFHSYCERNNEFCDEEEKYHRGYVQKNFWKQDDGIKFLYSVLTFNGIT